MISATKTKGNDVQDYRLMSDNEDKLGSVTQRNEENGILR